MNAPETLRLWSVTTLLKKGLQAGGPIVWWNCEQTALAAMGTPAARAWVTASLNAHGLEPTVKDIVNRRWDVSERHKERGSQIHAFAEAYALGKEPDPDKALPAEYVPYAEQLVRWWAKWQPVFLQAEAPVYNFERAYAGTLDGIATFPAFPGIQWLIDYKTTPKGPDARSRPPYPEVALQLAAYAHAERVGLIADRQYTDKSERYYKVDPSKETEPMPRVDRGMCVVVSPVDCFAVPVAIGDRPFDAFLHAQALAQWHEVDSKNAIGVNRYGNDDAPPLVRPPSRPSRSAPFGPDDVTAGEPPRPPVAPPFRVVEGGAA